ncbi:DNA-binding protein [Elysia marginata]|uniref:Viral histone-like protein n=1 Tax=Elysia marginata TaxID=1093978 RepID=A0AAV4H1Q5_9GAST|nr:DNA-binding protein [Elysia marginata]
MPPKKKNGAPTKAQVYSTIAEKTNLGKTDIVKVFDALEAVMVQSLRQHKQFTINGLIKVMIVHKAATKARPGRNPFTGEAIIIKAKPAHDVVRVRALKRLKDMT